MWGPCDSPTLYTLYTAHHHGRTPKAAAGGVSAMMESRLHNGVEGRSRKEEEEEEEEEGLLTNNE